LPRYTLDDANEKADRIRRVLISRHSEGGLSLLSDATLRALACREILLLILTQVSPEFEPVQTAIRKIIDALGWEMT